MTRKDFVLLSSVFKQAAATARASRADLSAFIALDDAASQIAQAIARQTKTFDSARFMRDCDIVTRRDPPPTVYGYDNKQIKPGDRVELSPNCPQWVRGNYFGEAIAVRSNGFVIVKLDRVAGSFPFDSSQLRSA